MTRSLEMTMRLVLLGILLKTDRQLALLCFKLFVIKRRNQPLSEDSYCHRSEKEGKVAICNKRVLIHMMVVH